MANFCSNCGASISGVNFCANCGTAVNGAGANTNTTNGTIPVNMNFDNTNTNGSGFFNSDTAKTVATAAGTVAGMSLLGSLLQGNKARHRMGGLPMGVMGMNMMRPPQGPCHHHGPTGHSPMWRSPMGHSNFDHGPGGRGPFGFGGGRGPGGPGGFGGPGPR